MREAGLPHEAIPVALFFFNVGVELGQLAFIAVCLGLWRIPPALSPAAGPAAAPR
ncbi:MAG: HupE/UreJ family protein [Myxococcaceae bacterium]